MFVIEGSGNLSEHLRRALLARTPLGNKQVVLITSRKSSAESLNNYIHRIIEFLRAVNLGSQSVVLFFSSVAVYMTNQYGDEKLAAESAISEFVRERRGLFLSLRLSNVIAERLVESRYRSFVSRISNAWLDDSMICVHGDWGVGRDFISIDSVTDAISQLVSIDLSVIEDLYSFDLGCGTLHSFKAIFDELSRLHAYCPMVNFYQGEIVPSAAAQIDWMEHLGIKIDVNWLDYLMKLSASKKIVY